MTDWRDQQHPTAPHRLVLDGVELVFGDGGILRRASAEQVATMTAHPMRAARFVEIAEAAPMPAAEAAPAAPAAPDTASATADVTPRAPRGRRPAPPPDSEGAE